MKTRAVEVKTLLPILSDSVVEIARCFKEQSIRSLSISSGPRGMLGLPYLFRELDMLDRVRKVRKSKRDTRTSEN
jgi:hypothetical protein